MDKQLHENAERVYGLFTENYISAFTDAELKLVKRDLEDLLDEVKDEIRTRRVQR